MENKSKINNLKHIDHGIYIVDQIQYINYNLKNPNVQEKEYIQDDSIAVKNEKFILQHLRCFAPLV